MARDVSTADVGAQTVHWPRAVHAFATTGEELASSTNPSARRMSRCQVVRREAAGHSSRTNAHVQRTCGAVPPIAQLQIPRASLVRMCSAAVLSVKLGCSHEAELGVPSSTTS